MWTEAEVQALIGQPESIRRDYKAGVMFDGDPESTWVQNLSKEVSALAEIPQGSTAYQANDGRYYGRSEFETKYLPDHEIRLRMSRGRVARAAVRLRLRRVTLGADHETELRTEHASAIEAFKTDAADAVRRFPELWDLMAAHYHPDEISFDLVLRNDGELTICQPAIDLRDERSEQLRRLDRSRWLAVPDPFKSNSIRISSPRSRSCTGLSKKRPVS